MAYNINVILTEGDHDSAFIYRILKTNNFINYRQAIKDFPYPLNEFLSIDLLKSNIEEVKIEELRRSRFLPFYVLEADEDNLVLIYSVGGESRSDIRTSLVKTLNSFNVNDPEAIQAITDTISVIYFFDSDFHGIAKRLEEIRLEINECFQNEKLPNDFDSGEVYKVENLKIGTFVFTEPDKDTGRLEDVLIPLMRDGNDDIFTEANKYLSIHSQTILFKDNLKFDENGILKKVNNQKFDSKKALVGTIGQLQKPGKSNTVCISDSDYLNDEKIKANVACNKIFEFITLALKTK